MRPVVLVVAALQVALPASMLAVRWAQEGSRPRSELPASWQMYSSIRPADYVGTDAAGLERPLSTRALPPVVRAVDVGRTVPDRLCARSPELVQIRRSGGPDPGTFRC